MNVKYTLYEVDFFLSTKSGNYAECHEVFGDRKTKTLIENRGYSKGDKVLVGFNGFEVIHNLQK